MVCLVGLVGLVYLVFVWWSDAEFPKEVTQEVFWTDNRVEEESGSVHVIVELLQEGMDQGCLTGTHFTCKDSKPPVVFDPADELGQGLLVSGTQVEGAWVRGNVKRLPGKTEMALIRWDHKLVKTVLSVE